MNTEQRFRDKIAPANAGGCELWTAATKANGYGAFWADGPVVYAHRYAWELANGPIPAGLCVLHRCDVRACVTAKHLFLGTYADNNADMITKGRDRLRGSEHGNAKLNEARAVEIFLATGFQKDIAERFGVSAPTVSLIKSRYTWAHATVGLPA